MHAPSFTKLVAGAAPALAAPYTLYHVRFSAPTIALNYPVTEVAILTLKAPENRAGVVEILSGIAKATNNLYAFGLTRGDENKYVAICGWESVEVCRWHSSWWGRGIDVTHRRLTGKPFRPQNLRQDLKSCTRLRTRIACIM